ncbi:MAG TPA: phospholipase D-like domain-containing protein [Verrucomicrobiae bacterium]|nr:phospholipase D-like domain-containing protein [Verrucomicrobiae bacterium]
MIELYPSPWRGVFESFLSGVGADLLIASPFIKSSEAEWICDALASKSVRLQVLTDIRAESILSGSLDISALRLFARASRDSKIIAVPRLHAKVYVRDEDLAIITSANLTPSGLEANYEYGVGLREPKLVRQIRSDLESYGRVGSAVDSKLLDDISQVSHDLVDEFQRVQRSAKAELRKEFNQKLRRAKVEFLRAQVGNRSAHSLYSEAIVYVLSKAPLTTAELHPRIQQLLPDLCDDSIELVIDGQRFGKRWKHAVRNAQQFLKRQGVIRFDGEQWLLARAIK